MKRKILMAFFCIVSANLFSQTYKLETVFGNKYPETYLSHWKVLESTVINQADTFSLWGYHSYSDSSANETYEVEYHKGDAKETYLFLSQIIEFTEKYREEDKVVTHISGLKVKTLKQLGVKYTLIFDKESKLVCLYNLKQWTGILAKFVSYCDNQKINYK